MKIIELKTKTVHHAKPKVESLRDVGWNAERIQQEVDGGGALGGGFYKVPGNDKLKGIW